MRLGKRISGSWEDDVHVKLTSAKKKVKPFSRKMQLFGIIQSLPQGCGEKVHWQSRCI